MLKLPKTVGSPSAREIMGLAGFGATFKWSTMLRMGLTVRFDVMEAGSGALPPLLL